MKPVAHCQFLPREDTVAVFNGFIQPIDVNIDTVTASLVTRRPTPIRAEVEVPSPVAAPPAAPSTACRAAPAPVPRHTVVGSRRRAVAALSPARHAIAAGLQLRFAHGPPNPGDGPSSQTRRLTCGGGSIFQREDGQGRERAGCSAEEAILNADI